MHFKTNYHTHHELCKHAGGRAEDFIKSAIHHGLTTLGFSDHAPSRVLDETFRMSWDEFPIYVNDVLKNKQKYRDKIIVEIGLEAEYLDMNLDYYDTLLSKVDYLILGQHFILTEDKNNPFKSTYDLTTPDDLEKYTNGLIAGMQSGKFSMIAHPDLCLFSYPQFDIHAKDVAIRLAEASKKYDVPLEFNANGIRRGTTVVKEGTRYYYPREEFWRIVQRVGCEVLLSSDSHSPNELYDKAIDDAYKLAHRIGIKFSSKLSFKPKNTVK